jgi:integrase
VFHGKVVQRSARADTEPKAKRTAKAKVDEAIKMLEAGVNPVSGRVKLGDYAQWWLDDEMRPQFDANGSRYRGVSQASFENYARDVRRIQKYLGDIRLDQLRVTHVRGMLLRMANAGETPENQRTTLVRLGTILNMAEANGDIVKNVAAARLVKRPEAPKRKPVKPQEDDLRRVLRAVDGDPLEVLVWLGLGAGLRRGDGLQWEDIDYVDPDLAWLVVRRRVSYLGFGVGRVEQDGLKNDDPEKRIPVGGLVLDALRRRWVHQLAEHRAAREPGHRKWRGQDYQPDTRTGFIFTNPSDGKPMNPRSADKHFAAIRDRADLDVDRFHALRHAFTTLLRSSVCGHVAAENCQFAAATLSWGQPAKR